MKSAALSINKVSIAPALVAAVVAVCLMSFAAPARADSLTSDQLSNVQALLQSYGVSDAKINAVSAVLTDNGSGDNHVGSTVGSSTPCAVPARALVRGMRSEDVKTLQERLSEDGYLSQDDVSGFFGSTTQAALKQWQSDNGVVASGTPETTGWGAVGQKTREALGKCEIHKIENRVEHGDNASSTPGMQPRGDRPNFEHGNGTPVPQAAPQQNGTDSAAGAVGQFLSDYSDAFNQNLAAVASAPYNFYVPILSDLFYNLGLN